MMRAEMGFETTNEFNTLNQILSGTWTGSTITAVGTVNYPGGTVSVGGASGTIYPDGTFDAANVPVALGPNMLTNVFTDPYGRSVTNTTSVTITNRTYAHDLNGNLTSDGVFTYQYDDANQLTNVVRTADGARVLSARYDALGRRVEAIRVDGTIDRYVYFPGSFLVLAVLDGSNTPKELYTRGPDLSGTLSSAGGIGGILACTYASGATYYSHADIMGNVIALTDASGSVVSTFRYTPFGQLSARTGTLLPRYLFSSKEFDRTASLYYYGYRYYSPRLARWMTRDPLEESEETWTYQYNRNASENYIDAWGDSIWDNFRESMKTILAALENAKSCITNMMQANAEAHAWWKSNQDQYTCCVGGREVALQDFPGVLLGEPGTTHGVLHCALGAIAKTHGVDENCLNLMNALWETWELYNPRYWEWMPPKAPSWWPSWIPWKKGKGIDGWIKDTVSDIKSVVEGYKGSGNKEECIPKECHRK